MAGCALLGTPEVPANGDVFLAGGLTPGYDIGLDTNLQRRDWLACLEDGCEGCCRMALPPGQQWGAVFITVGTPVQPPRRARDLSGFSTLHLDLRGEAGGETVQVGIKDACDADDGKETKITLGPLTAEWQSFNLDLGSFGGADLEQLYVVTEFVFDASTTEPEPARTVSFRNVRFLTTPCGDADRDGLVSLTDGIQALRAAAGLESVCSLAMCDMDGNGGITLTDGVQVLRAAAGLPAASHCSNGP